VIFRRKKPVGFSIICAYNNREKLNRFLLASLRDQTAPHEILLIDNCAGEFSNAPQTLNETVGKAKFDYLMFIHQDVALDSASWLTDAAKTLNKLGSFGAAGVAGRNATDLFASVSHGHPPRPAGPSRLKKPIPVQTLDGCLMIVPRAVFLEQGFDKETCSGWYLYVADYCLDMARRGRKVYVLPHAVYHESLGPADPAVYEKTKMKLLKKHKDHVQTVYTTIGIWNTEPF
jgi:GT2 family glycosyltransferase